MITFSKPVHDEVRALIDSVRRAEFTYSIVGVTRDYATLGARPVGSRPRGFVVDRQRTSLGYGGEVFRQAKAALARWEMFPPTMATLYWPSTPQTVGEVVAVLFRAGTHWSLNPCRVVYRLEETALGDSGEVNRVGFAYGTLPGHLERGEELFAVCHDRRDDQVWYELTAVSRPAHWVAWSGYPYTRYQQARFRRLSSESMVRGLGSPRSVPLEAAAAQS